MESGSREEEKTYIHNMDFYKSLTLNNIAGMHQVKEARIGVEIDQK